MESGYSVEENRKLLKGYTELTKDKSLQEAIAMSKDDLVYDGFLTMKWSESNHDHYTNNLKDRLGPAVTIEHTDWQEDGPTVSRGTDIKINLADPSLGKYVKAAIAAISAESGQDTFAHRTEKSRLLDGKEFNR